MHRNIGLGIRGNNWDDVERMDVLIDGAHLRNGFKEFRAGRGIRPQRSSRSIETRTARREIRPIMCPRCGMTYRITNSLRSFSGSKIWLAGWNKTSERPRYKCPICLKKFSGNYTLEFPRKERTVLHGRSRYNKHHCRCEACLAAIRVVARNKYRRRQERWRS